MTLDGHCVVTVTAAGEDFRVMTGAGKLKNWKSEKLTASPPGFQIFRISGFHPLLPPSKSCR
jgi:hypothetical protein